VKPNEASSVLRRTKRIEGWMAQEAAMLFALIDEVQKSNHIRGDLFEIGVHHGKSAVFLAAMARPRGEKVAVCDLFDSQQGNVSSSGKGSRQIFDANMAQFCVPDVQVQVYSGLSSTLAPAEIGTGYRFFHIDGGHNLEEALGDLQLAADSLVEQGVIAIDDAFKPEWPGVTEAIMRFLDQRQDFVAFVVGFGKLFITRQSAAELYIRAIADRELTRSYKICYPWHFKRLPFAGRTLGIFYIPTWIDKRKLLLFLKSYYYAHDWTQSGWLRGLKSMVLHKPSQS
jgi:hypothetical protein